MATLVPQPGFLEGETRGYAQHFSRARHLLAFMGWMVEEAPVVVDPDQVELPPELSTQKGPSAYLCKWPDLLARIFAKAWM